MAFISANGTVYSFAEYSDVTAMDQRLFEANEGLTEDVVEDALIKSTERILSQIRGSDWWRNYYTRKTTSALQPTMSTYFDVPALDATKIQARQSEFTDLCVYFALSEFLCPRVADFGNTDQAERQKIGFYGEKYRALLADLLEAGDWYNFDGTDTIGSDEKMPWAVNLVRRR